MDDGLDKYFTKARASLSEPAPIAEIRELLKTAPEAARGRWWQSGRMQVLLGLVVVLTALFFMLDNPFTRDGQKGVSEPTEPEGVTGKVEKVQGANEEVAGQDEAPGVVYEENEEAMAEEAAPKPAVPTANEIAPKTKTLGEKTALPPVEEEPPVGQPAIPPAEEGPSTAAADAVPEPEAPVVAEAPGAVNSGTATVSKPAAEESAKPAPEILTDKSTVKGSHRFEIPSTATKKEIAGLDKKLKDYGLTLNLSALEYDRKWISRFKGDMEALNGSGKARFNINSTDFKKVIITFDYSEVSGPGKMVVRAEQ